MATTSTAPRIAPPQLQPLAQRLKAWRAARARGQRIPDELWKAAADLAHVHGLSRTAAALKLSYYDLKRRLLAGRMQHNWQFWPDGVKRENGGPEPAWKGVKEAWKKSWPDWGIRLYKMTWQNPRPEIEIKDLDFVSAMTRSAPFLIAITSE